MTAFWLGLTRPSRLALGGALVVAVAVWAACILLVGPDSVARRRIHVSHDDDFAEVAAVSLRLARPAPGSRWAVLIGSSATREAIVNPRALERALPGRAQVAPMLAAAMTPVEMLALAEALPAGLSGVAVLEVAERHLATSPQENRDVIRVPRLPLDSAAVARLADAHGLARPRASVGNYFLDHAEFFLARPAAVGALFGRPAATYAWHQIDGMRPPTETDWRRLVNRSKAWLTRPEAVYGANEDLYVSVVGMLRDRGLDVVLVRAPRNPAFLERLDADPEVRAARTAMEERLAALAARAGAPLWYVDTEAELDPQAFKDYTHLFRPEGRQRFTSTLARKLADRLAGAR